MHRLTFKEYVESKNKLLLAGEECPRITLEYEITKYCKIPVTESPDDETKLQVSLKPKDTIEVLWEHNDPSYPTPRNIVLTSEGNKKVYPCWNNKKVLKWVQNNSLIKKK